MKNKIKNLLITGSIIGLAGLGYYHYDYLPQKESEKIMQKINEKYSRKRKPEDYLFKIITDRRQVKFEILGKYSKLTIINEFEQLECFYNTQNFDPENPIKLNFSRPNSPTKLRIEEQLSICKGDMDLIYLINTNQK